MASCAAIFGNRHLYVWDVEQPLWGPHYCYQPITSLDVLGSRVHGFVGRNSTPDFDGPSSFPHFQRDPAMIFVKYFSSFMWKLYNSYSYYISIILVISIYIYIHCIYTYLYKHRGLTIAFPWWFPRGFDRGKLTVSELENHHFILGNRWTTWTIFNSTPIIELTLISHGPKKNLHEIAMKNSQAEKNIIIYIYIYIYIYLHYRLDFSIIYIYIYVYTSIISSSYGEKSIGISPWSPGIGIRLPNQPTGAPAVRALGDLRFLRPKMEEFKGKN